MDTEQFNVQNENSYATQAYSSNLENNATLARLRLDNEPILREIELYLSGKRLAQRESKDGMIIEEAIQVSKPLANPEGVQRLMAFLRLTIASHNVQGNMSWDRYDAIIFEIHVDLAEYTMSHLHDWDIKIEDYNYIIDSIMPSIQLFISRTVENKERESYGVTLQTKESSVIGGQEKKGLLRGVFG